MIHKQRFPAQDALEMTHDGFSVMQRNVISPGHLRQSNSGRPGCRFLKFPIVYVASMNIVYPLSIYDRETEQYGGVVVFLNFALYM